MTQNLTRGWVAWPLAAAILLLGCGGSYHPPEGFSSGSSAISAADAGLELSRLQPRLRSSLHDLKVFWLSERSLEQVWDLEKSPEDADVVVVTCRPTDLSSDLVDLLKTWLRRGKGVLFTRPSLEVTWPKFFPAGYVYGLEYGGNDFAPIAGSALTENVEHLQSPFWCARGNEIFEVFPAAGVAPSKSAALGPEQLKTLLKPSGFLPILARPERNPAGLALFGTSYGKGRVAWLADRIDTFDGDCKQTADDVRLWSNLMHWLGQPKR